MTSCGVLLGEPQSSNLSNSTQSLMLGLQIPAEKVEIMSAMNVSLSDLQVCSPTFWDTSNLDKTLNSPDPDFTLCFEKTSLTWLPCLFLWFFLPLEVYCLRNTKAYRIPFNFYNISKLVLIALLSMLSAVYIANYFLDGRHVPVDIYSSVIKFFTFSLFFILTYANIRCGIRSSGVLFIFSLLLAIFGAPQFRTELKLLSNLPDTLIRGHEIVDFLSYVIYYSLVLSILFLNSFSDARPLVQRFPVEKNVCPENESSFLSQLFFAWFDELAWKGYRRPLTDDDLWSLERDLKATRIVGDFESKWYPTLEKLKRRNVETDSETHFENQKLLGFGSIDRSREKSPENASIVRPLFQAFGPYFLFGIALKLAEIVLIFVNPQILSAIIALVENQTEYLWHGYVYAIALFTIGSIKTLTRSQYARITCRTGLRIRVALVSFIYKKALKISNAARRNFTVGEIVNLMAVDAHRFLEFVEVSEVFWSTPLQICLAMYFLWAILGPSALAGLLIMIALIPINTFIGSKTKTFQVEQMKNKDDRLKLINEILSGIKVLKMYAWEPSFEKQVLRIRDKEIRVLKNTMYLNVATSFIWTCSPFVVTSVTFAVYVLSSDEHVLDAQKVFVSLSLFNILRAPLGQLPWFMTNLIQTIVAIKRINKFLNSEELDPNAVSHERRAESIIIENGQFSWEDYEGSPTLSSINLSVGSRSLIAIVGPVGSGKSSLLSAVLGEMYKQSGFVNTTGNLAYVPQQAWIQNATLKDNIINFGGATDDSFYEKVIASCALTSDLKSLPAGDQTEIGEQGVNLSGGQKQRVSLARAIYAQADIYLLDDPLSAVDSHVGKHIFENVIGPNGLLKEKTRVLVTHSVTYLSQVDFIIVLQNGTISESGTYNELVERKGNFAEFLATYIKEDSDDNEDEIGTRKIQDSNNEQCKTRNNSESTVSSVQFISRQKSVSESEVSRKEVVGEKLIEIEKTETGNVKWSVYSFYFRAVGPFLVTTAVLMDVFLQGFTTASNLWLSVWTSDTTAVVDGHQNVAKQNLYLVVYGLLGLGQASATVFMTFAICVGALKAARSLHTDFFQAVMHWPMHVFDCMPVGRILNRFSFDIDVIDNEFQHFILNSLSLGSEVVSTLLVIAYSTPLFTIVIIPVGAIYYFLQRVYVSASRQLKRIESVSRSPIFSHFGETISGVQSVRAYGLQKKFIQASESKVDHNLKSYFAGSVSNWWLTVRLESVSNLITFFATLFAVLSRNTLSAGLAGLSVNYALEMTLNLYWLVRMATEVETNIVSIERIKEFGEIVQEDSWEKPDDENNVSTDWPQQGNISFNDFRVRYREGLELVLKGITFNVNGGDKVGIAGRTGAGKSSLTLSLFRIVEAAGGKILIDNVNISKIGLHTLRGRLTIIPQDPVLFSGSLRTNLDPTERYTDECIWKALELAHLKTHVSNLNLGLQHEVGEGGHNFSVGQRQLICLARAVLRKTKILILDEATAAIDLETDDLIQATIRREFKDCTVLTIAHRLNTIMDYDRIIVLDRGRVVEFDSPSTLLKSKHSVFYDMAANAGLV